MNQNTDALQQVDCTNCESPDTEVHCAQTSTSGVAAGLQKIDCTSCGSSDTDWHCTQTNTSGIVDGRLRVSEVGTLFYLGCNYCSETIKTISGDKVARLLSDL